jgi:quinol monooxygenase YgiN
VSVQVLPENKAKIETVLTGIVTRARQLKGCLKYQWFVNPEDIYNYIAFAEFDSEENFALYRKSEIISMIGKQIVPLLKQKPAFKHFRTEIFEQG